jgi:DNA-directed RNA polymerase subunit N (RpoN/RPB10)
MSRKPTLKELREFSTLPWIRCPTCGRPTAQLQEKYDRLVEEKRKDFYDHAEEVFNSLLEQGFDEKSAEELATQSGEIFADRNFYKKAVEQLGIKDACCFRTLQNPIKMPLGAGIELDPAVDVGTRMSQLQLVSPVLPEAKGTTIKATPQQKPRFYPAR